MKTIGRSARAVTTLLALVGVCFAQQPQFAECGGRALTYEAFDEHFAARMKIRPWSPDPLVGGDKQFSTQHTRYIVVSRPDYRKPGPWGTAVWIRDTDGKGTPVMLAFLDHASGGVNLHWLNEKLLYGSVWWGRIISADFIFDVKNQRFIYREMANYGQLIQPCD